MGIAASLFFSTTDPSNCLDWRVRPSDEQYEAQQKRWRDLAGHLRSDLQSRTSLNVRWWLQGSYKFGTQVRPASQGQEFDIDLGIYFEWQGASEDGEHGAKELKDMVTASLEDYADSEGNDAQGVEDPKERCSRIHFDAAFHIDVPAYHLDADEDLRSLATESDTWEDSDPKAIYKWWKDLLPEVDRPRARRIVRYLKMWAALKFADGERPSSILLTVLVGLTYERLDLEELTGDDEVLRAVVDGIVGRLNRSTIVRNPVNDVEDLNRLSPEHTVNFVFALKELESISSRALAAPTKFSSADIWSEAFGHFFPIPSDDEAVKEIKGSKALVPISFVPEVRVKTTCGRQVIESFNRVGPIPKGCTIDFELSNAALLPYGAIVSWTVRNGGTEAEDENDLGHSSGHGSSSRETSSYEGVHYMDITVKLNGTLIGRRRVPVAITSTGVPVRNPPRPAWTRLRSGRR